MKTRRHRPLFISILVIILGLSVSFVLYKINSGKENPRSQFEKFLVREYRKVPQRTAGEKDEKAFDQPEMAAIHDYFMTLDPATHTVPRERLVPAMKETRAMASLKSGTNSLQWQGYEADMGGRTRAIMYDPNDATHHKVWAGGVTGGLWYNPNIQDMNSTWVPVSDFWACLAIRCITYDPNNPMTFYVGTGEAETAMQTYRESSGLGDGIWKSTDGGQTWNQMPSTTEFAYITDIVVRDENGNSVIYAGVASGLYQGTNHQSQPSDGLFRSADNGVTWQQVLPDITGKTIPYAVSDIALGADNRIYVGTRPNLDGDGAATLFYSDYGTVNSWVINETYKLEIENDPQYNIPGRVVIATAPSDPNVVYALIASGYTNPANNFNYFYCFHILRSSDKGQNYTEQPLPTDLTSGFNFATIAWHALDIAVDPNDADKITIGGLDIQQSVDGGNNWLRLSDWSLMYWGGGPQYIHADQHIIVYKPGSSSEMLFGCDGGIFYTADGTLTNPDFEERNKNYNTLQFYSCAIKPVAGSNFFLGGLQDNGSLYYTGDPLTIYNMVSGGDGAYCFYDQQNPIYSISSVYYNQYYLFINGNYFNALANWTSGIFVNPADYDYKLKNLYANAVDYIGTYSDNILKITDVFGIGQGEFDPVNTGSITYFSAIKYSPYSLSGKTTLFLGTNSGRLFKVHNAESIPAPTEITGSQFPTANISSIALGKSEDTLLVTFSNYGVVSIWQSYDGGQTWANKEGNLPDMPIRWALYHPDDAKYALLATETGVWECDDLDQSTVTWTPMTDGMANVRVDQLTIRAADNTVLAATHGRGLFTTTWDIVTGMKEKKTATFTVYPNPATDQFTISGNMDGTKNVEFKLYDQTGKLVLWEMSEIVSSSFDHKMNISALPNGVYYLGLYLNGRNVGTQKVIRY